MEIMKYLTVTLQIFLSLSFCLYIPFTKLGQQYLYLYGFPLAKVIKL
jgi:hypothetical protein